MTRLNKDFHAKFQPVGFTPYRIKSRIACQTSNYKDYPNLQIFLKDKKVPFNLIRSNDSKPYRAVIKGIPPAIPPKTIQKEPHALGLAAQNVIPLTAWRDETPLSMHTIELENVPQKISQLSHLHQNYCGTLQGTNHTTSVHPVSAILPHGGKLSSPSG
jgi:hypothetical protein